MQRGEFIGERVETITYVCERPGTVTIPTLVIHWWDLVVFSWKDVEFSIGNKFLYAGHTAPGPDLSHYFRSFETGLDVRHLLDFTIQGRQADFSLYFINFLYSNLAFLRFRADSFEVDV